MTSTSLNTPPAVFGLEWESRDAEYFLPGYSHDAVETRELFDAVCLAFTHDGPIEPPCLLTRKLGRERYVLFNATAPDADKAAAYFEDLRRFVRDYRATQARFKEIERKAEFDALGPDHGPEVRCEIELASRMLERFGEYVCDAAAIERLIKHRYLGRTELSRLRGMLKEARRHLQSKEEKVALRKIAREVRAA